MEENLSNYSASELAALLPRWLSIETEYANRKYGESNPQLGSLWGGLGDRSNPAYLEFPNYYGRFRAMYLAANGDPTILLRASQLLGKFVNAGRALIRVTIQAQTEMTRQVADEASLVVVEEACDQIVNTKAVTVNRLSDYMDQVVDPSLSLISRALDIGRLSVVLGLEKDLMQEQAQLFVDVAHTTGFIAQPGVSSSDEDNVLKIWHF